MLDFSFSLFPLSNFMTTLVVVVMATDTTWPFYNSCC
jgi:hypothetical protein